MNIMFTMVYNEHVQELQIVNRIILVSHLTTNINIYIISSEKPLAAISVPFYSSSYLMQPMKNVKKTYIQLALG